jgi:DNA mismatch endonuclease (patch repair protein)
MDSLKRKERSRNMAAIRSTGTKPEMMVRSLVHRMGYRYRLHAGDLPGKPDLVFRPRRKIIFVHGCFWHQHPEHACKDARMPKSNKRYWKPKLDRNVSRDAANTATLRKAGWRVLVIWECEVERCGAALERRIRKFLR